MTTAPVSVPALVSIDEFRRDDYDFVICGGGTAGLVVATRLTEDPNIKVGVVEAGKTKLGDMGVDIPAMCISLNGNPEYDWIYKTVPEVSTVYN